MTDNVRLSSLTKQMAFPRNFGEILLGIPVLNQWQCNQVKNIAGIVADCRQTVMIRNLTKYLTMYIG